MSNVKVILLSFVLSDTEKLIDYGVLLIMTVALERISQATLPIKRVMLACGECK